jgi:membrane fusion protein, copper/silver efflux system
METEDRMMNLRLTAYLVVLILALSIGIGSCNKGAADEQAGTAKTQSAADTQSQPANAEGQQQAVVYTCPMHPQVQQDKPGKCPICGMDLVKKA